MHRLEMTDKRAWIRHLSPTLLGIAMLLAATSAYAACGDPARSKLGAPIKLPSLAQSTNTAAAPSNTSIVGLWHVTYQADGQLFYEALDEWHSDGTEVESANVPPAEGNVCFGVWTQIAPGTVRLNHIGWAFDANGNSIGYFTLTETNVVAPAGNSYQGRFDYKFYDVNGALQQEIIGVQSATRLSVN